MLIPYVTSVWGLTTNVAIFAFFGLFAYDKYAKRWASKSGKHFVDGRITWSEKTQYQAQGQKALVSYSYRVNGQLFNGEMSLLNPLTADRVADDHPRGKEVIVYFAPKDPGFSRVGKPPTHFDIIGSTVLATLVAPLFGVNLISGFLYWVFLVA